MRLPCWPERVIRAVIHPRLNPLLRPGRPLHRPICELWITNYDFWFTIYSDWEGWPGVRQPTDSPGQYVA